MSPKGIISLLSQLTGVALFLNFLSPSFTQAQPADLAEKTLRIQIKKFQYGNSSPRLAYLQHSIPEVFQIAFLSAHSYIETRPPSSEIQVPLENSSSTHILEGTITEIGNSVYVRSKLRKATESSDEIHLPVLVAEPKDILVKTGPWVKSVIRLLADRHLIPLRIQPIKLGCIMWSKDRKTVPSEEVRNELLQTLGARFSKRPAFQMETSDGLGCVDANKSKSDKLSNQKTSNEDLAQRQPITIKGTISQTEPQGIKVKFMITDDAGLNLNIEPPIIYNVGVITDFSIRRMASSLDNVISGLFFNNGRKDEEFSQKYMQLSSSDLLKFALPVVTSLRRNETLVEPETKLGQAATILANISASSNNRTEKGKALLYLGIVQRAQARLTGQETYQDALDTLSKAIKNLKIASSKHSEAIPLLVESWIETGEIYYKDSRNLDESLSNFQHAIDLPYSQKILAHKVDEGSTAPQLANQDSELRKKLLHSLESLGEIYFVSEKSEDAIKTYKMLINYDPTVLMPRIFLSSILIEKKEYLEALKLLGTSSKLTCAKKDRKFTEMMLDSSRRTAIRGIVNERLEGKSYNAALEALVRLQDTCEPEANIHYLNAAIYAAKGMNLQEHHGQGTLPSNLKKAIQELAFGNNLDDKEGLKPERYYRSKLDLIELKIITGDVKMAYEEATALDRALENTGSLQGSAKPREYVGFIAKYLAAVSRTLQPSRDGQEADSEFLNTLARMDPNNRISSPWSFELFNEHIANSTTLSEENRKTIQELTRQAERYLIPPKK